MSRGFIRHKSTNKCVMPKYFNPFLFIKNKRLFLSFSALDKRRDMFSEGKAARPVRCDSPLQIVMAIWRALYFKKVRLTAITTCKGLTHPTRSPSRSVCRVQEGPKGSKGTLRPDFQANFRPRIFLKANVS
jgi:hypothetical protein